MCSAVVTSILFCFVETESVFEVSESIACCYCDVVVGDMEWEKEKVADAIIAKRVQDRIDEIPGFSVLCVCSQDILRE